MKKILGTLAFIALVSVAMTAQTAAGSTGAANPTSSPPPNASASVAPATAPAVTSTPTMTATATASPTTIPGATSAPAATPPSAPAATPLSVPTAAPTAPPAPQPQEGTHYLVTSALGNERAANLLARLEALYAIYNGVFHFDDGKLPGKLVVREFATKADFDAYLGKLTGESRNDFVYVHYLNPLKRELLVFDKPEPDYDASLAHQAFVQFIKAYIAEPPLWMLDGFAVLFEDLSFDPTTLKPQVRENLAWLPTVKAYMAKKGLMPLDKFLGASADDARANIDVFYPESWAFVSFLVNDREGDFTRLLWESIATLDPKANLADNQAAINKRLSDWYGLDATQAAFEAYIQSRMTYPELLSSGTDLYAKKDYDKAAAAFDEAESLDPSGYVAPYYLGLIAYEKGDWAAADSMYRTALSRGANPATTGYAIGLNEIARGLIKEGAADLAKAAAADPDRYKAKVDDILARLGAQ